MAEREFIPGRYRHFKGHEYDALFLASDSEDPERKLVVYRNVESGDAWVRPFVMFMEHVERPDYSGPRFIHLGPSEGLE